MPYVISVITFFGTIPTSAEESVVFRVCFSLLWISYLGPTVAPFPLLEPQWVFQGKWYSATNYFYPSVTFCLFYSYNYVIGYHICGIAMESCLFSGFILGHYYLSFSSWTFLFSFALVVQASLTTLSLISLLYLQVCMLPCIANWRCSCIATACRLQAKRGACWFWMSIKNSIKNKTGCLAGLGPY